MTFFALIDASSLAKRYIPEPGSAEVDHVFRNLGTTSMFVVTIGIGEVASILVRKRNSRSISNAEYRHSKSDFFAEIILPSFPSKVTAEEAVVITSISHIETHAINATDAIILQLSLNLAEELRAQGDDLMVVASDQRLLRAAHAEGLAT